MRLEHALSEIRMHNYVTRPGLADFLGMYHGLLNLAFPILATVRDGIYTPYTLTNEDFNSKEWYVADLEEYADAIYGPAPGSSTLESAQQPRVVSQNPKRSKRNAKRRR